MRDATCVGHGTSGTCNPGLKCCPHDRAGTNAAGSGIFEADGSPVHLIGHTGPCNCPHGGTFASVEGSSLLEAEGRAVTLVGHATVCQGCGAGGEHASGCRLLEVEY